MTGRAWMRTSSEKLWQRLLARLAPGARRARPRVSLVYVGRRPHERGGRLRRMTPRVDHRSSLHLHVSWPALSFEKRTRLSEGAAATRGVNRIDVNNLSLHHHLHKRGLRQTVLAPRPGLVSASRWAMIGALASGAAPALVLRERERGDRVESLRARHTSRQPRVTAAAGPSRVVARGADRRAASNVSPAGTVTPQFLRADRLLAPSVGAGEGRPGLAPALAATRTLVVRQTPPAAVRALPVRVARHLSPLRTRAGAAAAHAMGRVWRRTEIVRHVVSAQGPFEQPAPRVLHHQADERATPPTPAAPEQSAPRLPSRPTAQPVIDVARLSDEVYRHIQRRVRIERERRGA